MEKTLKKFKAINYIDAIVCKYIQTSIEKSMKKQDTSSVDKYVSMLQYSSNFIKELDLELEECQRDNARLLRIVATQDQEISNLKEKIKRLEKHYETKGL